MAKSESNREIAERITADLGYQGGWQNQQALTAAIEATLNAERERCAKIAENSPPMKRPDDDEPSDFDEGQRFGARLIAAAIRGSNH